MSDDTQVVLLRCGEYIRGVAPEALAGKLQKPFSGSGNDVLHRHAGIVDSVFATDQVLRPQRTGPPGAGKIWAPPALFLSTPLPPPASRTAISIARKVHMTHM